MGCFYIEGASHLCHKIERVTGAAAWCWEMSLCCPQVSVQRVLRLTGAVSLVQGAGQRPLLCFPREGQQPWMISQCLREVYERRRGFQSPGVPSVYSWWIYHPFIGVLLSSSWIVFVWQQIIMCIISRHFAEALFRHKLGKISGKVGLFILEAVFCHRCCCYLMTCCVTCNILLHLCPSWERGPSHVTPSQIPRVSFPLKWFLFLFW